MAASMRAEGEADPTGHGGIAQAFFGMAGEATVTKRTLILLRWLVVLATAYLVLFSGQFDSSEAFDLPYSPGVSALLLLFLLSNFLLELVPVRLFSSSLALSGLVMLDSLFVSAALYLAPSIETDIFILYFFVILLAAAGGSFSGIVVAAVLVPTLYLLALAITVGSSHVVRTDTLLRVPFLFCVCVFYGYLAERGRRDRQRAESAETSEDAKTRLFATLTHDVRNALGTIIGFSEILLEEWHERFPPEATDLLQRIKMTSIHSSQLIANLLDAGRIEQGRLQTPRTRIDLGPIVQRVVQRYGAQAAIKKISVKIDVDPVVPSVAGDDLQLDRVFANLLSNALKFTPDEGRVDVRVGSRDERVEVEIADSGPGIPPEDRPRIFQAYGQTDSGSSAGGTGLGLYVVSTVLEAHGASIELDSAEAGGAKFRVSFPTAPPVASPEPRTRE